MGNKVVEYSPCDSLKPFIELYWEGSFNYNSTQRIGMQLIPNGSIELIIHLNDLHCDLQKNSQWSQTPDYMIIGLYTKPYEIRFENHVKVFAIRFKPEGIYNVFGVPASEFIERYEDMSLVIGKEFRDFCHRIREERRVRNKIKRTESYLLKNLQSRKIELSYVNGAAELIRESKTINIEELAATLCISKRQLEREFKNKVGISPKHYFRITRINEVLKCLHGNQKMDLTKVAYQCGYYDQAHFIHDFKSISGTKPSIFKGKRGLLIGVSSLGFYDS